MNLLHLALSLLFGFGGLLPQTAVAVVDGVVLKLGTNEAIAKAVVELRSTTDSQMYRATTVQDGRFSFVDVQPGVYRLSVKRAGFALFVYGQRTPNGAGSSITVVANGSVRNLRLTLTPAAVISGRIYDRQGQPLVNAQVSAMKVSYSQGRRGLIAFFRTYTNDLGEYRLFWLAPGSYYVGAAPLVGTQRALAFGAQGPDPVYDVRGLVQPVTTETPPTNETTVTTYFPGTLDGLAATAIPLKPGDDIRGIDFTAGTAQSRHIRGTVINGDTGQLVPGPLQILMTSDTDGGARMMPAANNPFDLGAVVPGAYTLATTARNLTGRTPVEVVDRDVEVTLSITEGFSIPGQLTFEGESAEHKAPPSASLRVNLRLDPANAPGPAGATPTADGSFRLQQIPTGNYRVSITPALQDGYIKSARLGDADVLTPGLHLERQPSGILAIVIGLNPGTLEGTVVDSNQKPMSNVTVAIVPEMAQRVRADLFKNVTTDASGAFQIKTITPGNYKVFAWEDVENGAWLNEEFLRPFENQGTPVRIDEGGRATVRITP